MKWAWRATLAIMLLGLCSARADASTPADAAASGKGGALTPIILQLKWYHGFQFAGYYAALEKGFYADEGLAVTFREGGANIYSVDEVVSGRAAYGIASPNLLLDRFNGKKVVALASIFQHSPTIILARKDSGIATPSDIAGRKIMIARDGNPEVMAMLRNEGIKREAFDSVPISGSLDDLLAGRIDARSAYLTNEPFLMRKEGVDFSIIRPSQYGIDFYGDILFTREGEVQRSLSQTQAFVRASLRGWLYTLKNMEEVVDLVYSKYSQARSGDHLLFEAKTMAELINADMVEIGHMNPYRWVHIADTFAKLELAPPSYSLDGFLIGNWIELDQANRRRTILAVSSGSIVLVLGLWAAFMVRARIREQRVLHTAAQQYRDVVETSVDGFWMLDLNGHLLIVNDAYVRRSGYSRDELLARRISDLDAVETPEQTASRIKKVISEGSDNFETKHRTKSGALWDVEIRASYSRVSGRFYVFLHDITERRESEEQLKEMVDRLTASNVELERFAYVAAHDLREPIRTMVSYSQHLLKKLGLNADGDVRASLDFVIGGAKRMDSLVNDLLTYARVSNDTQSFGSVDLNHVLSDVQSDLLRAIESSHAEIVVAPLPEIIGARPQLHQLFQNLIANALKFRHPDRTPRIDISADRTDEGWLVSISDNGIGFDPKFAERIFVPFKRLHTEQSYPGTGIGLAVCRRIVDRHYGKIWAESPGQGDGATFQMMFPAAAPVAR